MERSVSKARLDIYIYYIRIYPRPSASSIDVFWFSSVFFCFIRHFELRYTWISIARIARIKYLNYYLSRFTFIYKFFSSESLRGRHAFFIFDISVPLFIIFCWNRNSRESLCRNASFLSLLPFKNPPGVPYGKTFFSSFRKIIIDFSSLSYQLRRDPARGVGFFLIVEKSDTDRSRAFLSPQITRERCGTRFVDKLGLSARRTSIVISIASRSLSCTVLECCRQDTQSDRRLCGYMWIYTVCAESTSERRQQNHKHAAWRDQTSNQSQHYCRGGK